MDFFKKGQDLLKKSSGSKPAEQKPAGEQDKQDYGDKAAGFIGKQTGHKMDPKTTEKVTDGARGLYEKFTGKKVDPKYSN